MHPGSQWTTHKGDEWWYESRGVRASASFVPASSAISIGPITGLNSPDSLHMLLTDTIHRFPGIEPRIAVTKATRPLLQELVARDIIRWEPLEHPLSIEARITFVVA